jgi:hypothetical protein
LEDVRAIKPVDVRGAQRLWDLPITIALEVLARYGDQGMDVVQEMEDLLEVCIPTTPDGVARLEKEFDAKRRVQLPKRLRDPKKVLAEIKRRCNAKQE